MQVRVALDGPGALPPKELLVAFAPGVNRKKEHPPAEQKAIQPRHHFSQVQEPALPAFSPNRHLSMCSQAP